MSATRSDTSKSNKLHDLLTELKNTLSSAQQDEFWQLFSENGGKPLIQDILGDEENKRVTFIARGDKASDFQLVSSVCGPSMIKNMHHIEYS